MDNNLKISSIQDKPMNTKLNDGRRYYHSNDNMNKQRDFLTTLKEKIKSSETEEEKSNQKRR